MVYRPILVDGKPSCPWQISMKLSQQSFNTTAWYFGIDQVEADCHFWWVCKSPNSVIKMRDIAKCSTLPYENIPPSGLLGDENNTHVSRDTDASCHFVAPFILNMYTHPFVIINPKNHCYMNSVIQLLFSILRTISNNFQFNSSTEGSISKFLFEIARSASSSTDVDALKFRLVQYDKFCSGEQQEDASECLMMLIELINKGSVPYCGYNDNNLTGVSLSEILFSFMLENILWAMHVDWDPPHLSLVACYILHILVPLPCRNW